MSYIERLKTVCTTCVVVVGCLGLNIVSGGKLWGGRGVAHLLAMRCTRFRFHFCIWNECSECIQWWNEFKVHKFWLEEKTLCRGRQKNFSNNFRGKHFYYECDGERKFSLALCRSLKTLERSRWGGKEEVEELKRRLTAVGASMLHVAFASRTWRLDAFLMSQWMSEWVRCIRMEKCAQQRGKKLG